MSPLPNFAAYSARPVGRSREEGGLCSAFDEGLDATRQHGQGTITMAEVQLGPELLSTLCGRSRRRLRDIQSSCQVVMKLDRVRGGLRIYGPEAAIEAAQRQLSSLGGPRKTVPGAVWAELFRTRTLQTSKQSIVLHLQELSGCRIHIERSRHEVRIFGPQDSTAVAEKLLEELEKLTTEAAVPTGDAADSLKIQDIAEELGVTARLDETEVVLLGLKDRVQLAVREISKYMDHMEGYVMQLSREDADILNADWPVMSMEGFDPSELSTQGGFGSSSSGSLPPMSPPVYRTVPQPPSPSHMQGGRRQNQALYAPQSARMPLVMNRAQGHGGHEQSECGGVCPTCGVGRFCHYCGQQTWVYLIGTSHPGSLRPEMGADSSTPKANDAATRTPPQPAQHLYMGEAMDAGNQWMAMPTGPAPMEAVVGEASPRGSGVGQCMVGAPANGLVMGSMLPMCFPVSMAPDQTSPMPWVSNMPVAMAQGFPDGTVNGNQMVRHVYMVPAYTTSPSDESSHVHHF